MSSGSSDEVHKEQLQQDNNNNNPPEETTTVMVVENPDDPPQPPAAAAEESNTPVVEEEDVAANEKEEETAKEEDAVADGDESEVEKEDTTNEWIKPEGPPQTGEDGKYTEPSTGPPDDDLEWNADRGMWLRRRQQEPNQTVTPRRILPRRQASKVSSQQKDDSANKKTETPGTNRRPKKIPYDGDIKLLKKDKYGRYLLPGPPPREGYVWNRVDATWIPGKRPTSRRIARKSSDDAQGSKDVIESSTHTTLPIIPFEGDIETLEKDSYGRYLMPGSPPVSGYTWNRFDATWVPGKRAKYANENIDSEAEAETPRLTRRQSSKKSNDDGDDDDDDDQSDDDNGDHDQSDGSDQKSTDSDNDDDVRDNTSNEDKSGELGNQNDEFSSEVDDSIPMGTSERFLRPASPPLRGYRWDRESGFWFVGQCGIIPLKDDDKPITPAEKSRITNWAGQRIDPATFIPHDGPLLKDKSGKRYLRPGTPPQPGYTWERYMGGWVPGIMTNSGTQTTTNTEETRSTKRSRSSQTKGNETDSDPLESKNFVAPKSSLRMENGKYLIPDEEPPKSGATWDKRHGIWIKDRSRYNRQDASVFAARVARRKGVQFCLDWVAPKEKPILARTGEYFVRPVEKPPGPIYHWNRSVGVWIPGKSDEIESASGKLAENNASPSTMEDDSLDAGSIESFRGSSQSRPRTPKRTGKEGIDWMAPEDMSSLKVGANGRYCLRPDGDPPHPDFCVWDGHQAAWMRKETSRDKRQQPPETVDLSPYNKPKKHRRVNTAESVEDRLNLDEKMSLVDGEDVSNYEQRQKRLRTPIRHGKEGVDWFAPPDLSMLKIGSNGRYFLRPPGDPPKSGLYWDGYQAAWVKKSNVFYYNRRGSEISSLGNEAELEDISEPAPNTNVGGSGIENYSDTSDVGSRSSTPGIATRTSRRFEQVVDSTAWLQPEIPPSFVDGKFVRPKGNAPIEGYVWSSRRGVWVPGRQLIGVVPHAETVERLEGKNKRKIPKRDRAPSLRNRRAWDKKEKRTIDEFSPDFKHASDQLGGPTLSLDLTVTYGPEIPVDQEERNESVSASDVFHPDSKWQEPKPHTPQPTLYEKQRNPRPAPSGTVVCSLKALQQEFRCVICLGYIQNARLVVQCNHRFCGDCIERLLSQVGQRKECPICRTHIPSRRSLAPDPSFDRLIHKILPRELIVSEIDEEHIVTQNLNVENKNLQKVIEQKKQAEALRKSQLAEGTLETITEPSDVTLQPNFTPPLIKIELKLREKEGLMQLDPLKMPFVTISGDATILVLKSFLVQKYGFLSRKVHIWSILDSRPTTLEDSMSLHFVATHWADEYFGCYMPLYYGFEQKIDALEPSI